MSLSRALDEAFNVLHRDPARAEQLCRAALQQGDDPGARLMLAGALRLQGDFEGALALTNPLVSAHANWPGALFEHGMALGGAGRRNEALALLTKLAERGELPGLWREIGDQYWALNDRESAQQAYMRHLSTVAPEPLVLEALTALQRKDAQTAETALLRQLALHPSDVLAQRHLAEVYSSTDRYAESEALLRACLERAPHFHFGRYGLAMVLLHDHRLPPALQQAETLVAAAPTRREYLHLKAEILVRLGEFETAASTLEQLIAAHPNAGEAWSSFGNVLRTLGRREECEAAYRKAIATNTQAGEAFWGLANLKTLQLSEGDIADMRAKLTTLADPDDRVSLLFALGKALEDRGQADEAFAAYSEANKARRARLPHDREARAEEIRRTRAVLTAAFFAERSGVGRPEGDPIFVVGMPRSGSTLVEQILASHSQVEGTMELVELIAMAKRLGADGRYPENLRDMAPEALEALGVEYLERSAVFRKSRAPFFIDKMPNNFAHVGLIHLMLPNARIVDVRRHPMACGFSVFKQHWATGQSFAYDLRDIGEFYRGYVELMAHFDAVLPGRVHRVIYEDLVAHPDREITRLLEACGLPFEAACLRFHENKRAVRTPSSEQVRRPINTAGLDGWKPFEAWLDPLRRALGPVLDFYPSAPPQLLEGRSA